MLAILLRHESPHLSFFPLLRDLPRKTYDRTTTTTLHGAVEKIITSSDPSEPEKAQIDIENADKLYREIRIEITLT
jgi:hypothetical protein